MAERRGRRSLQCIAFAAAAIRGGMRASRPTANIEQISITLVGNGLDRSAMLVHFLQYPHKRNAQERSLPLRVILNEVKDPLYG